MGGLPAPRVATAPARLVLAKRSSTPRNFAPKPPPVAEALCSLKWIQKPSVPTSRNETTDHIPNVTSSTLTIVYSPHAVRVGKEPKHLAVTTQRRRGDIAVTLTEEGVVEGALAHTELALSASLIPRVSPPLIHQRGRHCPGVPRAFRNKPLLTQAPLGI